MDGFLMGCVIAIFVEHLYAIFNIKIEEASGALLVKLVHGLKQVFAHSDQIYWLTMLIYLSLTISLFILMKKAP